MSDEDDNVTHAVFVGLGADEPLRMAPFHDEAERRAYWRRVAEMRAERDRRRGGS